MLYGAVVLMVICLTVLSLQQLLDAGQYKYRFSVLRKLGVEEKAYGKTYFKAIKRLVWAANYRSSPCICGCNHLLYPNYFSRNFSIYWGWCIDVTDRSNSRDFGNLVDLLFHQHLDIIPKVHFRKVGET